jgi:hypothetical protein
LQASCESTRLLRDVLAELSVDGGGSFRERVDLRTPEHFDALRVTREHPALCMAMGRQERARIASAQSAWRLREDIEQMRARAER